MYIVLESLSEIDPRFSADLQYLEQYKHWEFEVAYIDPNHPHTIKLDQIAHRFVSEEVARACKFASADHNDRLGILEGSEIHDELIHASMEPHSYKPKVYYTMTEADKVDTLKFLKVEMEIALEKYYRDELTAEQRVANQAYKDIIQAEIAACTTIFDAKKLIHTRFGTSSNHILAQEHNWGPTTINLAQ